MPDHTTPDPLTLTPTEPHPPGLWSAEHPGSPRAELEPAPEPKGTRDDRTLPMWVGDGYAPRARWRRPTADGGRPDMTAHQLVLALEGVCTHAGHGRRNGRAWSGTDTATIRELEHRTWGVGELSMLRDVRAPRWLEPLARKVGRDGRVWRRPGWIDFLAAVVAAYRAGALGLRLSLEELASEFAGSRRTAARWVAELVALELVAVRRTWTADTGTRERERRRNVYCVGPELERQVGPGLLEGAAALEGSGVYARTATRCARAARARARADRRELQGRAWARQRIPVPRSEARSDAGAAGPVPAGPQGGVRRRPRRGASEVIPDRGSAILAPHPPSLRAGISGARGPAGTGPAAPASERASLRPAAAPARANAGGTRASPPDTGGPGGPLGRVQREEPGRARPGPVTPERPPWMPSPERLAELAPAMLGAGGSAQARLAFGLELEPCRGCAGRGAVRLPCGDSYRCAACEGTGERRPRGERRADA